MRFIAIIVVVAIIAVVVIFALLIQRLKSRQGEELDHMRGRVDLAENQIAVAKQTLRTIRDLQGDSSFDASMALEEIIRLSDEFYTKPTTRKGITQS